MKHMKKILLVATLLAAMTARAQMTPEAIMGSAPGMPSWESVADYFKGLTYYIPLGIEPHRNTAIDGYFASLKTATKKANTSVMSQPMNVDNSAAQARAAQLNKQSQSRAAAGQKMQNFVMSLTPEQQQKFMNCKNEQESMNYLKKIGKWDEFAALMSGTPTPSDNGGLTKEEEKWATMDLSAEIEQSADLIAKAREAKAKLKEEINKAWESNNALLSLPGKIEGAQEDAAYGHGNSGTVAQLRAQYQRELDNFYSIWAPKWLRAQQDMLDALRAALIVDKKVDKKAEILGRLSGVGPNPAIAQTAYIRAFEYLREAEDILMGEEFVEPEE